MRKVEAESSDSDVYVYSIHLNSLEKNTNAQRPTFQVIINNQTLSLTADTGAEVNVMAERDFATLSPQPTLEETNTKKCFHMDPASRCPSEEHFKPTYDINQLEAVKNSTS